ncbi:YraN family protein [Patescibacteria group bacterium]|nr:YraN family protein [Patescibacteria group bacterium]MBU1721525.1 YraN family protein [Patescibacteria group bacterium]MBU1901491.1 YraN family protein [Patescibacteria group bacterium]
MSGKTQVIGAWGEAKAASFLGGEGYEIVDKNISCRMGEIDIIAYRELPHYGRTLCFIEVKTRGYGQGSAARATNYKKIQRIQKTAIWYCQRKKIDREITAIQFEHVSVYGSPERGVKEIKHFVIEM